MRILSNTPQLILLISMFVGGCTTYVAAPSSDDAAQQLITNSQNFVSPTKNLALDIHGVYNVNSIPLVPSQNPINGMPTYDKFTQNGINYSVLSTGNATGRSLYFVSQTNQFYALGSSEGIIKSADKIGTSNFAGKFTEMSIDNGVLSPQNSGTIVLSFDANANKLVSIYGPSTPLSYEWRATDAKFVGTGSTSGETIATGSTDLLGSYKVDNPTSQTFGSFWAIGK